MNALLLLAIGGIALTVGDIIFKYWLERTGSYLSFFYFGGIFVYLVGLILLVESFKSKNIAVASAIFVIFNIVTLAIVSWLYFGEKLSLVQIIGITLAIIAILLLEMKA